MLDPSLCPFCFGPAVRSSPCRACGYDRRKEEKTEALALGAELAGRYVVGGLIGQGGFGATYRGYDGRLASVVAIKEYFPFGSARRDRDGVSIAVTRPDQETFDYGCGKFLDEARTLAKLRSAPKVVSVFDFFKENNTAYIIMEFLSGMTLAQRQAQHPDKRVPPDIALPIFLEILGALSDIHSQNILHRDISPANILIDDRNTIKLLDFGAARQALSTKDQRMTVILKPGYAPFEQYSDVANHGPWSDIYAAGATFYTLLTGAKPVDSLQRLIADTLKPLSAVGVRLAPRAEQAIMKALAVQPASRWQTAADFAEALSAGMAAAPSRPGRPADGPAPAESRSPEAKVDERVGQPVSVAEFRRCLDEHAKFLAGKPNGRRLNLSMRSLAGVKIGAVNFSGAELTGTNFAGCDLSRANFANANLFCADFTGADVSDANFDNCDLRGARFEDAEVAGTSFAGADCRDGIMLVQHRDGHLHNIKGEAPRTRDEAPVREMAVAAARPGGSGARSLTYGTASRSGAGVRSRTIGGGRPPPGDGEITEADREAVSVRGDDRKTAKAVRQVCDIDAGLQKKIAEHRKWIESASCDGQRLVQENGDLSGLQVPYVDWSAAKFQFVNMMDINLRQARVAMADFSGCVLDRAILSATDARGAKFMFCNIQNAIFIGAVLSPIVSAQGQRWCATFVKSDLRGSNFESADCQCADFRGADLRNTNFKNAILKEADFTGATVDGADFTDAILDRSVGLAIPVPV